MYDWLVTLSREVDLFWTGNARPLSTTLYFANKYLNLLSYVVTGVQLAPTSNKVCVPSHSPQTLNCAIECGYDNHRGVYRMTGNTSLFQY